MGTDGEPGEAKENFLGKVLVGTGQKKFFGYRWVSGTGQKIFGYKWVPGTGLICNFFELVEKHLVGFILASRPIIQ